MTASIVRYIALSIWRQALCGILLDQCSGKHCAVYCLINMAASIVHILLDQYGGKHCAVYCLINVAASI
jgi:hypothetical protein